MGALLEFTVRPSDIDENFSSRQAYKKVSQNRWEWESCIGTVVVEQTASAQSQPYCLSIRPNNQGHITQERANRLAIDLAARYKTAKLTWK